MRQLAWLSARPRSADAKPDAAEPPSRLEAMVARGEWPDFPPVSPVLFDNPELPAGHPVMVQWMFDAGPCEPGGGGAAPLSWRGLNAWTIGTGIAPEPWQGRLLRRLSAEWLAEGDKARKPDCPEPMREVEAEAATGSSIAERIKQGFGYQAAVAKKAKRG